MENCGGSVAFSVAHFRSISPESYTYNGVPYVPASSATGTSPIVSSPSALPKYCATRLSTDATWSSTSDHALDGASVAADALRKPARPNHRQQSGTSPTPPG